MSICFHRYRSGITRTSRRQAVARQGISDSVPYSEPGGYLTFRPVLLLQNSALHKTVSALRPILHGYHKNYCSFQKGG
jgi:hypothetical protein